MFIAAVFTIAKSRTQPECPQTDDQQAHENMPIIANYERNANTMRYHLISVRMAIIKMSTKTNSG